MLQTFFREHTSFRVNTENRNVKDSNLYHDIPTRNHCGRLAIIPSR